MFCHMFTLNLGNSAVLVQLIEFHKKCNNSLSFKGRVYKQLPVPLLKPGEQNRLKALFISKTTTTKKTVVNHDLRAKPRVNTPQTNPEIALPVLKRVQAIRVTAKCHRTGSCTRGAFSLSAR